MTMCVNASQRQVDVMRAATAFVIVAQESQGSRSLETECKQVSEQSRKEGVAFGGGLYPGHRTVED